MKLQVKTVREQGRPSTRTILKFWPRSTPMSVVMAFWKQLGYPRNGEFKK